MPRYCALDMSRVPHSVMLLPAKERADAIVELVQTTEDVAELPLLVTGTTPMSALAELAVVGIFACAGCTVVFLFTLMAYAVCTCAWALLATTAALLAALSVHPIPLKVTGHSWLLRSRVPLLLFQYFSFRMVWTGEPDLRERERVSGDQLPSRCLRCPLHAPVVR